MLDAIGHDFSKVEISNSKIQMPKYKCQLADKFQVEAPKARRFLKLFAHLEKQFFFFSGQ
jgi:hypothetical protein